MIFSNILIFHTSYKTFLNTRKIKIRLFFIHKILVTTLLTIDSLFQRDAHVTGGEFELFFRF